MNTFCRNQSLSKVTINRDGGTRGGGAEGRTSPPPFWQNRRRRQVAAACHITTTCPPRFSDLAPSLDRPKWPALFFWHNLMHFWIQDYLGFHRLDCVKTCCCNARPDSCFFSVWISALWIFWILFCHLQKKFKMIIKHKGNFLKIRIPCACVIFISRIKSMLHIKLAQSQKVFHITLISMS